MEAINKVILLISGYPGKSTLIKKSCNDIPMLGGGCLKQVKINGKIFNLSLWDTNGSERTRSIIKMFLKVSNIVLLVYDITNRSTFVNLDYWYNTINEILDKDEIVIGLVGNKID